MYRLKTIISIVLTLIFIVKINVAQDIPVIQKSTDKVVINGKKYYIHIVKKGETIYSLCKTYQVTPEELEENNPDISKGLKINASVKIPLHTNDVSNGIKHIVKKGETLYSIAKLYNVDTKLIVEQNPGSEDNINIDDTLLINERIPIPDTIIEDENFIYHQVNMGETLYSIARKYGVKVKNLKKQNKNIDLNNLKVGQLVRISKKDVAFVKTEPGTYDDKYYYLKIGSKQTLYAISKKFKISISDIEKANPELKNRQLIAGETIRVPILNEYIFSIIEPNKQKDKPDSTTKVISEEKIEISVFDTASYPCMSFKYNYTDTLNIALFLPLYGNLNDTLLKPDDEGNTEKKIYSRSKIFIEFYQGVLLAVKSLSSDSMNINLHVFDTRNDTNRVKSLINNEIFKNLDLIIGPIYSENLEIVARKAKQYKINIVSPLSVNNNFIKNNYYTFQVNPPNEIKKEYWLNKIFSNNLDNVILINDGNNFNQELSNEIKETYLNKYIGLIDSANVYFKEHLYFNSEDSVITRSLIKGVKNTIIIPSTNQAFVTDVISKLNTVAKEYDISVYGMDIWITYSNIELEYFHNLNIHLFTNSHIDYNNIAVNKFIQEYRSYFNAEPGKFGYQAYDVAYYFVNALKKYGNEFRFCLNDYLTESLETNFDFVRNNPNNGFENNYLYTIEFKKDFTKLVTH